MLSDTQVRAILARLGSEHARYIQDQVNRGRALEAGRYAARLCAPADLVPSMARMALTAPRG